MIQRLLELELNNFRLFRGRHTIPLDADIVLVHGANGSGKSSLVSALEFAVTGHVEDLARFEKDYPRCLRNVYADPSKPTTTRLRYIDDNGTAEQLLALKPENGEISTFTILPEDQEYFRDRCCLPQNRLSRLVNDYQKSSPKSDEIPLVRFLSEVLGRNQLDNLEQGLGVAGDIRNVRKACEESRWVVDAGKRLEQDKKRWQGDWEKLTARERKNNEVLQELAVGVALDSGAQKEDIVSTLRQTREAIRSKQQAKQRQLDSQKQSLARREGRLASLKEILTAPQLPQVPSNLGSDRKSRQFDDEAALGVAGGSDLVEVLRLVRKHLEGDDCPVCGRDFGELNQGSLAQRVDAEIERMATTRPSVTSAVDMLAGENVETLDASSRTLEETERPGEQRFEAERALRDLAEKVGIESRQDTGTPAELMARLETHFVAIRSRLEGQKLQRSANDLGQLDPALYEAEAIARERSNLDRTRTELEQRQNEIDRATAGIGKVVKTAKSIRKIAGEIRQDLLRQVFAQPLNDLWRNLFRRLAPGETFAPELADPASWLGKRRSWTRAKASGIDDDFEHLGSVLSSGNLNTAGLTLYLALNLIEKPKMNCLVLDDPVQNMDDLHLVQVASLLRSLAHDAGRQLFVAVHERSLFDFLCLELGPTHKDSSLMAIEVTREADGQSSRVTCTPHDWEPGKLAFGS